MSAQAQTPEALSKMRSVAPLQANAVHWTPPKAAPATLDPATAMDDPAALVRFFEANKARIDVTNMGHPDIAKALAQVFLKANRTFMAEKLLSLAVAKWPEDVALNRAWGRVLLSLGQPAARDRLRKTIELAPTDPTSKYLLGMALLRIEPRTAMGTQEAIGLFETVLVLDPQYTDADGVGPADLRQVITRLKSGDRQAGQR